MTDPCRAALDAMAAAIATNFRTRVHAQAENHINEAPANARRTIDLVE